MDYTQTAKEAVAAWDRGDTLWTIEMGGLGPGYEQCIQVLAVETVRAALAEEERTDKALTQEEFLKIRDARIHELDDDLGGCTGAQVGAATNIAWRAYTDGWGPMLKKAKEQGIEDDRFTMISKHWPKVST